MKNKVKKAICDYQMLSLSDKVLVGLSGGADSVALLLVLIELGYDVCTCHINHQLRENESLRDENFCRNLCQKLNIPFSVKYVDVTGYCKDFKDSVELAARKLRYDALQKECNGIKLATAHTASDNIETVLINLTRGTGLRGLCGIPPVRGNIIRPLIYCSREEIEDYLEKKGQDYVTDSTNLSDDYTRNKIRHNVIPVLKDINNSLIKSFNNSVQIIRHDNDYIEDKVNALLLKVTKDEYFDFSNFNETSDVILNRCIAKILKDKGLVCTSQKVNEIRDIISCDGKINLSNDVYALSKSGMIKIYCEKKHTPVFFSKQVVFDEWITFKNKKIYFGLTNNYKALQNDNVNILLTFVCFDYDKIQGKAIVRNRRNGDKIKFAGYSYTTNVKKLFNSKVPADKRDDILFVADDSGVIYIEGFYVAQRVMVDDTTRRKVYINIIEGKV